jgi:membrane associated rhomboid family serine protease
MMNNNIHGFDGGRRNNGNDNPNEEPGCMESISNYISAVPFYCKLVMFGSTALYIFDWIYPIDRLMVNWIPRTIEKYEFWRIITAPYMHDQLLMLFFCLLSYLPTAIIRERSIGTSRMLLEFVIINLFVQTLFLPLAYLFQSAFPGMKIASLGLWPVIMCEIVIECNRYPDMERAFCFCPFVLPSKYHPLLYVLLFAVMNLPGSCSIIAGFLTGYLFVFGVLSCFQIGKTFGTWFEETFLCCVSGTSSFVKQSSIEESG